MATRMDSMSSGGWAAPLTSASIDFRAGYFRSLADAPWAYFCQGRGELLALAAVWLGSIVMNIPTGGPGIGLLDTALAVNRGALGLLICFSLIPQLLAQGRYLAFASLTAMSVAAFGAAHIHVVAPLVQTAAGHALNCYHCYLTQTLPTVATMAVVKLSWSLVEQQKSAAIIGRERSEAELRFLRTQMNPHLLMNSLNNVYSYSLERSQRAPEMILKLSGVLRYMLYEAGDEQVPLRRELDYIQDYFELQRLATEGRGDVRLKIEGDPSGWTIAPLILIVLIENCFKHATETVEKITVEVDLRLHNGVLHLTTVNNLADEQLTHQPERAGGIGLENLRRRLELLYPDRFNIETGSAAGCFRARLSVALDPE